MKRIIVCMDGTWQSLNQDKLTNIGVIARSIAHKEKRDDGSYVHQIVIYTQGVGSSIGALSKLSFSERAAANFTRLAGGAFGQGLEDAIVDTYLRLAFNYEAEDEIYIFGFSRGAFAARRLAGFINTAGIVSRRHTDKAREGFRLYYDKPKDGASEDEKRDHETAARQFRMLYGKGARNEDGTRRQTDDAPPIAFLGVFDTVAQRGMNDVLASLMPWHDPETFRFKNYRVCPNVRAMRHAVAVDESRIGFPPMLFTDLDTSNPPGKRVFEQRWFAGTHGDVGGGEGSKLAACALKWVAEGARDAGLRFYAKHGEDGSPMDDVFAEAGLDPFNADITRPSLWRSLQPMNLPWRGRRIWARKERPTLEDARYALDDTVVRRFRSDAVRPRYRPGALKPFTKVFKDWPDGPAA